MKLETITPDKCLDLSGLRCPHLLIAAIEALQTLPPDHILQITATDLNAPSSLSAWARQSGNPLLDVYPENDHFIFLLQRRQPASLTQTKEPKT